jgi:hypothetical protein
MRRDRLTPRFRALQRAANDFLWGTKTTQAKASEHYSTARAEATSSAELSAGTRYEGSPDCQM